MFTDAQLSTSLLTVPAAVLLRAPRVAVVEAAVLVPAVVVARVVPVAAQPLPELCPLHRKPQAARVDVVVRAAAVAEAAAVAVVVVKPVPLAAVALKSPASRSSICCWPLVLTSIRN
jgi:hypothetical protein